MINECLTNFFLSNLTFSFFKSILYGDRIDSHAVCCYASLSANVSKIHGNLKHPSLSQFIFMNNKQVLVIYTLVIFISVSSTTISKDFWIMLLNVRHMELNYICKFWNSLFKYQAYNWNFLQIKSKYKSKRQPLNRFRICQAS